MSQRILRVGILGQGRSGHDIHLRWLRTADTQYRVVAVADAMADRHEAAVELGARAYTDYRKLLADRELQLDLVVNALPSPFHPGATIEALNAGYDVVSEKPQAYTVAGFDSIVKAARKHRKRYFPFQNARFYPYFVKMREVISSGKLGRIVFVRLNWSGFSRRWDWQAFRKYHGGNLLNTGPHPLDHAMVLFGPKMPRVFSRLAHENPFGDADNFANILLYGPAGTPLIEVVVNSLQAYPQGEQNHVCGTFGGLAGGPDGLRWRYFDPAKAPQHRFQGQWSEKRQFCSEELPWQEETWTPAPEQRNGFMAMSQGFYNNVYDVVVRGGKPEIELSQVRRQIAVIEECIRQNRHARQKRRR